MISTSLQINLAPGDFRLVQHLLPHQIETWRGQVDELLLVVDLHRSAGRFAEGWEIGKERLLEFLSRLEGVQTTYVDYSESARNRVALEWTGGREIPIKDFRGGPSYAYFFGLSEAKGRFVLHSDADIFFGGRSETWMDEARTLSEKYPDILFIAPHSGPHSADGIIRTLDCIPDSRAPGGQRFNFMSTRLFMVDKEKFHHKIAAFKPQLPGIRSRIKAWMEGNPPWDLPENWMSRAMGEAEMCRFEFLGSGNGMWSLHPPFRCEDFYKKLPEIIRAVEENHIPDAQRGCHDINEAMADWSEATEKLKYYRWWRRHLSR